MSLFLTIFLKKATTCCNRFQTVVGFRPPLRSLMLTLSALILREGVNGDYFLGLRSQAVLNNFRNSFSLRMSSVNRW